MILRALQLQDAIDNFCGYSLRAQKPEDRIPSEDLLTSEDWQILVELVAILQPLWRLTKRFEGNTYLRFGEVIPNLCLLQRQLLGFCDLFSDPRNYQMARLEDVIYVALPDQDQDEDPAPTEPEPPLPLELPAPDRLRRATRLPTYLQDYEVDLPTRRPDGVPEAAPAPQKMEEDMGEQACLQLSSQGKAIIRYSIELMIGKLAEYESLLEGCITPWAAMAMDPRLQMRWVAKNLPERESSILANLRQFYDSYYPAVEQPLPEQPFAAPDSTEERSRPAYNALLDFDDDDEEDIVDELTDYLALPRAKNTAENELLDWWAARREQYPRLSRMATDLLSIPAMSSENERSFSLAKLVITSQRQALKHTTINKLVCLKAWNRDSHPTTA